jgi:hypothetical protein
MTCAPVRSCLPFARTDFFFTAFFSARARTVFCYVAIPCPGPTPSSQTKPSWADWSAELVKFKATLKGMLMVMKGERKPAPSSRFALGHEPSDGCSAIADQHGVLF